MYSPILVAYSTRTGSTGEVAEFIAEDLRREGLTVELHRLRDLKSLPACSAIVLGAPIYMGKLPAEFKQFLRRSQTQIAAMPTWFYVLGPIRGKAWEFRDTAEHARSQLAKYPGIQPHDVKIIGGRFDPKNLPFPYSLTSHLPVFPLKDDPATDVRNWKDIRAWTSEIADDLCLRFEVPGLTMRLNGAVLR